MNSQEVGFNSHISSYINERNIKHVSLSQRQPYWYVTKQTWMSTAKQLTQYFFFISATVECCSCYCYCCCFMAIWWQSHICRFQTKLSKLDLDQSVNFQVICSLHSVVLRPLWRVMNALCYIPANTDIGHLQNASFHKELLL